MGENHIQKAKQKKKFFLNECRFGEKRTTDRVSHTIKREIHTKIKIFKILLSSVFKSLCKVEPSNARLMWAMCLCRNRKKNLPL